MCKAQFYKLWLERTFIRPLLIVDLLAGLLAIIFGVIAYYYPEWGGTMSFLLWSIPGSVLVVGIVIGFLLAPYYIYRDGEKERNKLLTLLEARPSLWIRDEWIKLLTDVTKVKFPRKIAWVFNVSIANRSPNQFLGIRSIILRLEYHNTIKNLRPYLGVPSSDFQNAPVGDIEIDKYLQPSEPYSGKLVFVEDYDGTEEQLSNKITPWDTATIIIIDSQELEHPFPVSVKNLTWK